jgi:hypothetical protein
MATQKDFFDGLKARLQADAGLAAWVTEHFAPKTLTYFDGAPAGPVDLSEESLDLPSVTIEPDDGEARVAVLGGPKRFRITVPMLVTFIWRAASATALHAQRLTLPEIVLAAVAADHRLGGAVNRAWLDPDASWAWETTETPIVYFGARVLGEYDRLTA